MRRKVCYCDLCGEEKNFSEVYSIKVDSLKFINYANYDAFGASKRIIDICHDCVVDIKAYIQKHMNERNNHPMVTIKIPKMPTNYE